MEKNTGGELAARIGLGIRRVRQSKCISQDKLAVLCEIEKASISRIESGKTNFTVSSLLKICKALNIDVGEVVS